MDIQNFVSGEWKPTSDYRTFLPEPMNLEWYIADPELNTLIARANRSLGELNAFSMYIPDVNFFITMHILKEATNSSRIEGTQTRLEEGLYDLEDILPERRDDWQEVQNYVKAMDSSIEHLRTLPVSTRLLKEAHKTLMQGVRGRHMNPGKFRRSQNWIGGSRIQDASFVPPVHTEVAPLMDDLEFFLNNDAIHVPDLVRIAMAHYQFETIHPFLDGNGRLGRLLITLYLVSRGLLEKPTLYLSAFFEKHRASYYDSLNGVRTSNQLGQWLRFFMVGIVETTKQGKTTLQQILNLKEETESQIMLTFGKRAPKARLLLDALWKNPMTSAAKVEKQLHVSTPTANALIKAFQTAGILEEQTGFKRNRVFIFQRYLKLFKD